MKIAAMFGSSTGAIAATAAGAVLLVAGAVGYSVFLSDPDPTEIETLSVEGPVASDPDMESADVLPVADADVDADAPFASPTAPLLDVVRVEPDGSTLIAGQTDPDLTVAIMLDGEEVALTDADASGAFVAMLTLPPSDAPRMISAEVRPDGLPAIAGPESVLVAPFALAGLEPDADAPAPDAPAIEAAPASTAPSGVAGDAETVGDVADATASDLPATDAPSGVEESAFAELATPDAAIPDNAPDLDAFAGVTDLTIPDLSASVGTSTAPIAARPSLSTPQPSQAPAVLIAGPDGLRIAQGPGTPDVQTEVQLDAISYDAEGAVILAGRGPATADIQVYLNNQPIQLGEVGPSGAWSLQLPDVDPGTYTLSIAELAADGSVESRVETPFLREDPERVAEAPAQAAAQGIDVITVQPGFTLWGIAETNFGEGILYVQIFEENRDQIRDPNWIFPGQIFRLPEMDEDTPEN